MKILITGATDGIGFEAAKRFASEGHTVLIHGRSAQKLDAALGQIKGAQGFLADFSDLGAVATLAEDIKTKHDTRDVLINNAGILKAPSPKAPNGMDLRFVVNTLAVAALTNGLLPLIPAAGRVLNLSSAAQAPVDPSVMLGQTPASDFDAYAQSKLAMTIWTQETSKATSNGPVMASINPGSLLATKMVKDGFGMAGNDIGIGVDILHRGALSDAFANAHGAYFDNDTGQFSPPHAAAQHPEHVRAVMELIENSLSA